MIRGVIDRRILINYRVKPEALQALLPEPFAPHVTHGWGMAGICLIRLKQLRPAGMPAMIGLTSENAAHRIAVEWLEEGERRVGVYIPRRDTSSRLNTWAGGRIFPGAHRRAHFQVQENEARFDISMRSDDGEASLHFRGALAQAMPPGSMFGSVADAGAFFEQGSLGYSPSLLQSEYESLELRTEQWRLQPLAMHETRSSYFDDPQRFPPCSVEFDCALIMLDAECAWARGQALDPSAVALVRAPRAVTAQCLGLSGTWR